MSVVITKFRRLQPFPKFYLHGMHAVKSAWRGLNLAELKWIFCEGEKAMLVSLNVIVHLELRIVGGVFSGQYFDLTFDPG
jgi:hypothetical protein